MAPHTATRMDRRSFLAASAMTAGTVLLPRFASSVSSVSSVSSAPEAPGSFDYIFLTDTHIEPELNAADGCSLAFREASKLHADFAIHGGDHVMDALGVGRQRSTAIFDLYGHTEQVLGMKVHHTIGNHDPVGLYTKSGIETTDPGYGKQTFIERMGPTYYSFDHKGYHFIVLDSIQPTPDRNWEAAIDAPQVEWLKADLAKLAPGAPIIVTCHVPLATGFASYSPPLSIGSGTTPPSTHPQLIVANAWEVIPLLEAHNVLAIFQGHTHVNEVVSFHGLQFITSGAVCGNWWQGTRMGTAEGFTVVSLRNGKLTFRYETSGFKSVDPHNT